MNNNDIIQSVVCMVAIDGKIDPKEHKFLSDLCQRLNVSNDMLAKFIEQATQGQRKVKVPESQTEKIELLSLLVQAAIVDGVVAPQEYKILQTMAEKMHIEPQKLQQLIEVYLPMSQKTTNTSTPESPKNNPSTFIFSNQRADKKQEAAPVFYKRSGKFSLHLIWGFFLIGIAIHFLALGYAYLVTQFPYVKYVKFLLPIPIIFIAYMINFFILGGFHVRNRIIASIVSIFTACITLYMMWVNFEYMLLHNQNVKVDFWGLLFDPMLVWKNITLFAQGGYYFSALSPILLWGSWIAEAVIIISGIYGLSLSVFDDEVICEKCLSSAKSKDNIVNFAIDAIDNNDDFQKSLLRQDIASLAGHIRISTDHDPVSYRIDCKACEECEEFFTMSLIKESRSKTENNTTETKKQYVFKNLCITNSAYKQLVAIASTLKENPDRKMEMVKID